MGSKMIIFKTSPQISNTWFLIDAENAIVGKIATKIINLVRNKHSPRFSSNINHKIFVVVTNTDKLKFTGKKETNKTYWRHSGYFGGIKKQTAKELRKKNSTKILQHALSGMLP